MCEESLGQLMEARGLGGCTLPAPVCVVPAPALSWAGAGRGAQLHLRFC